MTMADRLVVMNLGVAEQVGTPRDVYQTPASAFVAGFIGSPSMNFIDARVSATRDGLEVGDLVVPLNGDRSLEAGQPVTLGIRPEDLLVETEAAAMPLKIELVEHLGTDTIVHGMAVDGPRQSIILRFHGDRDFRVGDSVQAAVNPDKIHLFDPETGRRLYT